MRRYMAQIIDGKKTAADIRGEIKEAAAELKRGKGIVPGLAVVLVGDDPASKIYVRGKKNACAEPVFRASITTRRT